MCRLPIALAAMLVACGQPAPPSPRVPQMVAPAASTAPLHDGDWALISSQRFLLAAPVPDAPAWRVDDRSGLWLVATHEPSQSTLFLRAWREGAVVDHGACERSARSWRPDLFGHDATELMGRRPLGAPLGFDTEVGFLVRREGASLRAVAAAFGANVRRCVAVVYVTAVDGPDAERAAAERLAFATARILGRLEGRSIEDRVRTLQR